MEIKRKDGTTRDWSAHLRRNILAYGDVRGADFFLLITPDRLYLCKDAGSSELRPVPPAYEVDIRPTLKPFYQRAGLDPKEVSGNAFELIVTDWLDDLLRAEREVGREAENQDWLEAPGLLDAIGNGHIRHELAS